MALIDYNLRYELPFKDVDANQWRVRIYDRDNAGAVERLKGTGDPVNIYYEADEEFTKGIIGSSCSIRVYGTPNMDGTSDLTQFFTDDEERFYVKVEYFQNGTYKTYWSGFLHQDEYIENITSDPYEVELVALDRLGTTDTTGDELGWFADTPLVLSDIVNRYILETGLEFTLEESTGLSTQNGQSLSFLRDQFVWGETFLDGDGEFFKMKSISEIVSNMAIALNCRVWQQEGKLMFKSVKPQLATIANWTLPSSLDQIGDDLYARHLAAKRVTNISIQTASKNLLKNGSFEENAVLSTSPNYWSKPVSNSLASIEVSDEAVNDGSTKSLKTINNRVSDSAFNSSTLSQKLGQYTLLQTTTQNIDFGYFDDLQGILKVRFFVNNTDNEEPYEIRLSLMRNNNIEDKFYDWETGSWGASFNYAFLDSESDGSWKELELPFVMYGWNFYNSTTNISGSTPITLRIHTMNYKDDGSISNVEVFYDNMELRLYNANGDTRTAILPDTRFYNLSTDDDTSSKTGSIDIEIDQGLTTAETRVDTILANKFYLLNNKVLGQYVNLVTGNAEDVSFNDSVLPLYRPLPSLLMNLRRDLDEKSKKVFSATLATKRVDGQRLLTIGEGLAAGASYTDVSQPGLSIDSDFLNFSLSHSGYTNYDRATTTVELAGALSGLSGQRIRVNSRSGSMGNVANQSVIIVEFIENGTGVVLGDSTFNANEGNQTKTFEFEVPFVNPVDLIVKISGFSINAQVDDTYGLNSVEVEAFNENWRPIFFGDRWNIDYNGYSSDGIVGFTRFDASLKGNRYRTDAIKLP